MASIFFDAALTYLCTGYSVFPCVPGSRTPLIKWKEFQLRYPTLEELENWWSRWPHANIAIITGWISELVILDVDSIVGDKFVKKRGITIKMPHSETTPGRSHYYLRYPDFEVRNSTNKSLGLDVRGNGGFGLAPPSIHPSGHIYNWIEEPFTGLPSCPLSIEEYLKEREANRVNKKRTGQKSRKRKKQTTTKRDRQLWREIEAIVKSNPKINRWLKTPKSTDRSGHDWGLVMLCLEHGIANEEWLQTILLHNKHGKANSRRNPEIYITEIIRDAKAKIK